MPTPVNLDEVVKDYVCQICGTIPIAPRILGPCSHIFCKKCIKNKLASESVCPLCKRACSTREVFTLGEKSCLAHRAWSKIVVKCKYHTDNCGWTGPIISYQSHKQYCPIIENTNLRDGIRIINANLTKALLENEELKKTLQELEWELEMKNFENEKLGAEMSEAVVDLQEKIVQLRTSRSQPIAQVGKKKLKLNIK